MLTLKIKTDHNKQYLETSLSGKSLLNIPQLNKGTAFTQEERHSFNLLGKLPFAVETLETQLERTYAQYQLCESDLTRNIFLHRMIDTNQVLFYALVTKYLKEMLPILYTPIVAKAVQEFSHKFRTPRGLYLSYEEREYMDQILDNRTNPDIDIIAITDGEGVLGIGDQGIGGMDILIAKLMVYTLCGGISPLRTLPIMLDVGTNNKGLSNDPLYVGDRRARIEGEPYDQFIDDFIQTVKRKFPKALLHWEDFGRGNAYRLLNKYRDELCTFNDDIQGTAAVVVATLLAGVEATGIPFEQHRIIVFGAGSAGMGITNAIYNTLRLRSLSETQARDCFWLIDRQGLLTRNLKDLTDEQKPFARANPFSPDTPFKNIFKGFLRLFKRLILRQKQNDKPSSKDLERTIEEIKPTILIGCSGQGGAFTESIIRTMALHCAQPIILPLSNPIELSEAKPKDLIEWTNAKAIIACGSPFEDVVYQNKTYRIAQSNNALIYPGIGLGAVAVKASRLTDSILAAACQALSEQSPLRKNKEAPVLPEITEARAISKHVAIAVAKQAIKEGLAQENAHANVEKLIEELMWKPEYLPFVKV